MASIATCPGCAAQLAIPDVATAESRAQCPECAAEFAMYETIQLALPQARLLSASDPKSLADAITREDAAEMTPLAAEEKSTAEETCPAGTPQEPGGNRPAANTPLADWQQRLEQGVLAATSSAEEPPLAPTAKETFFPTTTETVTETHATPPSDKAATLLASPPPVRVSDHQPRDEASSATTTQSPASLDAKPVANTLPAPASPPRSPALTTAKSTPSPAQTTAPSASPQRPASARAPRKKWKKVAVLVTAAFLVATPLGAYAWLRTGGPQAAFFRLTEVLPSFFVPAAGGPEAAPAADLPPTSAPVALADSAPPPTQLHVDRQLRPATAEQLVPTSPQSPTTAATFRQRLAEAQAALPSFLAGQLSQDTDMLPVKGKAYMALCRLAEQFDLLHQLGLSPRTQQQIQFGQALFEQTAAREDAQQDLAHIASRWLAYEERSTPGIFFLGEMENPHTVGGETHGHIALLGHPQIKIPVVFISPPKNPGQRIAVVGRIEQTDAALPQVTAFYTFALPDTER